MVKNTQSRKWAFFYNDRNASQWAKQTQKLQFWEAQRLKLGLGRVKSSGVFFRMGWVNKKFQIKVIYVKVPKYGILCIINKYWNTLNASIFLLFWSDWVTWVIQVFLSYSSQVKLGKKIAIYVLS